jgi:hypothetical protein
MAYKIGFRGQCYDDTYPLYAIVHPDYVINTKTMQTLTKVSVDAAMAAENYTPKAGEVAASAAWEALHHGWWNNDATNTPAGGGQPPAAQTPTIVPVTGLPITGDPNGTQKVDLDLNFHGSVKAGTFTITYNVGAGDATVTATVLATDTPTQAAGKVAAAIDSVTELGASKSGSTVTVTPTNGTSLTKLEASFA